MYEIEYFILCITIIVVLRFWDTNNLPMAIIMIIGLTFNIASVIYKSIVYKKNDIKNIIRKILILIVSIVYLVSIISYLNSWKLQGGNNTPPRVIFTVMLNIVNTYFMFGRRLQLIIIMCSWRVSKKCRYYIILSLNYRSELKL